MKNKIGTKERPLKLQAPPLSSEYTMHVEEKDGQDVLVCTVGKTVLLYDYRCLEDLHAMLKKHGDWMELGSADEQAREGRYCRSLGPLLQESREGLVWFKERPSQKVRYVHPSLDGKNGLAELTHEAKGNKMRAK
jgi:hypothetical protein